MQKTIAVNRLAWLAGGVVLGLAIAQFIPHEKAYANTADRDTQFSMLTIPVGVSAAGINDPMDAVFILDFLTGQLKGAALNRQIAKFSSFYFRDLAKDFDVDGDADPHYCMVSGYSQMPNQQGVSMASGMLFVGELTSGKVAGYSFPWREQGTGGPVPIVPMDVFQWKQPSPKGK
jgi:hypothetical protein